MPGYLYAFFPPISSVLAIETVILDYCLLSHKNLLRPPWQDVLLALVSSILLVMRASGNLRLAAVGVSNILLESEAVREYREIVDTLIIRKVIR